MISDEEIKKFQRWAKQAVEDGSRGLAITLAMDPVVVFAMATELLQVRNLRRALKKAGDASDKRNREAGNER